MLPLEPTRLFLQEKKVMTVVLVILTCVQGHAQLAKEKCNFLGSIISGSVPSDFTTYWNQITPENAGKWGSVEPARDDMSWTGLDLAYNTAKDNGFLFKQHTFVWGQQQPNWIADIPQNEQKEEVEEWIKAYCEKYPETDFIDVVNEPLHAVPGYAAALGGQGTTGWDWVIWSFEKARQYCPNAKLALNDYNIISNDGATNAYLTIINLLKERNLIDIIGEQGHFLETTPLNTIKGNLDKLHATGLPIHISEYDVHLLNDNAQRDKYVEQFPVLWNHPGVQGITLWGYKEGAIWRENAYLVRSDGTARPALTWLASYTSTALGGSFCLPPVGILEDESSIKVYPNPAINGTFTVDPGQGEFEIQIFDLHGRVTKSLNILDGHPVEVQMQNNTGIHIMRVFDGRHTTFRKIAFN